LLLGGTLQANGNDGNLVYTTGGGGSGGSIMLHVASAHFGTTNLTAVGGNLGGVGRIAIYYAEYYDGTIVPPPYTMLDTSSDNVTVFTNPPVSQESFIGWSTTFNAGASGIPSLAYQWNFNNVPIPNATNQLLALVNLNVTNQGSYSVTVSNVVGSVTCSNAYLTIYNATNYPPGDQLTYLEKYLYGLNPLTNDTDGDGISDYAKIFVYNSNPLFTNTAGDGIPDAWKIQYGLVPSVNYANIQVGATGVTYLQVYQYDATHTNQLDPRNPFFSPGTSIYETLNGGQHTNNFYYDHEDRLLGMESSRGVSIGYQYDGNGNLVHQTVLSRASETNGLPVLWLWLNSLTNQPGIAYESSSGNGWNNYQEWLAGLSPNSNSVPSLLNNPGTNIASLTVPFTPSNFVVGVGDLESVPGDEIVVGADGNPGTNNNSLFILTQTATNWLEQQISIGALGITSIAVGQPTNRPAPAIYVGLRQTGGSGAIWELSQTNGLWQTNVLIVSTNEAAYVLGVRSVDVLASFATNGLDSALYSLTYSNGIWNQTILSTNTSHRGLGSLALMPSRIALDASMRLIDSGGIEMIASNFELYVNGYQVPSNSVYNPATQKWYYETPSAMDWPNAEAFCQNLGGNLVTISSGGENSFLAENLPNWPAWIGLYADSWSEQITPNGPTYTPGPTGWASGASDGFTDYVNCGPNPYWYYYIPFDNFAVFYNTNGSCGGNGWYSDVQSASYFGIGEATGLSAYFTNQWLIPEPPATNRFAWRGLSLAAGSLRPNLTNSTSIIYAFADDQNPSGQLEAGSDFNLAEYVVSGNTWTTNTLLEVPITSDNVAQSFSLAAVNFTGTGDDSLFTGEPDGRVYSWTATNGTSPLQRQLFSDAYVGMAWQAMCSVQMPAFGEGLAGLVVNPTNQNTCCVMFWPPQAVLPTPQPSVIETAPDAITIPATGSLGAMASLTVRLWSADGDSSTPFLQYQVFGSTNWQNATLTMLDGAPYSPASRVSALPTGADHTLVWNTMADFGSVATNVYVQARAMDFMLLGGWSVSVPYQVDTQPPFQINSGSTNLQLTTNGFQLQVTGGDGSGPLVIYASTNLIDWMPILTNLPFFGATNVFDPAATNFRYRFYRAGEQ
jgi:YD repeat-containing protein